MCQRILYPNARTHTHAHAHAHAHTSQTKSPAQGILQRAKQNKDDTSVNTPPCASRVTGRPTPLMDEASGARERGDSPMIRSWGGDAECLGLNGVIKIQRGGQSGDIYAASSWFIYTLKPWVINGHKARLQSPPRVLCQNSWKRCVTFGMDTAVCVVVVVVVVVVVCIPAVRVLWRVLWSSSMSMMLRDRIWSYLSLSRLVAHRTNQPPVTRSSALIDWYISCVF